MSRRWCKFAGSGGKVQDARIEGSRKRPPHADFVADENSKGPAMCRAFCFALLLLFYQVEHNCYATYILWWLSELGGLGA